MTKSAHLRVYSPEGNGSAEPVPAFVRTYGLLSESPGEAYRVVEWNGRRLVCPQNLRLRVLESTLAFANTFRRWGVGLIPEAAAEAADRELDDYHTAHPDHRSHILTSAWHVPVRWFTAFLPSEKYIYEEEDGPRIRFRTDIHQARIRTERALEILQGLEMFPGPADELQRLVEWLAPFPSESMLELDYGEVAGLFDSKQVIFDDSCELIQESLEALAQGDMVRAGENYGKVVHRWAPAFSVTFSS